MSTPTPDQIKTLDQSRQRLVQLTRSLASLITSLNQSDPLPSWPSLQSQASIISNNLLSISDHLSTNHPLLSSLTAYPSPSFPSRSQPATLEQLLRTKLDPRVDDWVARGRRAAAAAAQISPEPGSTSTTGDQEESSANLNLNLNLSDADLSELWQWAPVEANVEARRRNWGGNFTLEEKENPGVQNVVTGLRRVLEEDDDDDDDRDDEDESGEEEEQGEDEEMEVVGGMNNGRALDQTQAPAQAQVQPQGLGVDSAAPPKVVAPVVPLNDILRFMTTGVQPGRR